MTATLPLVCSEASDPSELTQVQPLSAASDDRGLMGPPPFAIAPVTDNEVALEPLKWAGEFVQDEDFLEDDGEDLEEEESKALPLGAAAVILAICFSEGISASILNPFCGIMVQDEFGVPSDEVGYWVGLLTASFFLGQLISSFPIGIAADRLGRRPVLLMGILGNAITLSMFGLSKWMWWAMLWRFLGGVTNGNNAVVKTYIRDISTDKTQAKMYSLRSSMRAAGFLLGPILGGFLSRPVDTTPFSIFLRTSELLTTVFKEFPYLLPCLFAAFLNVIMLITGLIYLKETLKKKESSLLVSRSESIIFDSGSEINKVITLELKCEPPSRAVGKLSFLSALSRDVVIAISLYGLISLIWVGFQETFPVWAIRSHEENGLEFDEAQLGIINGITASGMILFQAFCYAPLDHKFGTLKLFRGMLILWGPVFVVVPLMQRFVSFPAVVWVGLIATIFVLNAFGTALMAAANLMINNAAEAEHIGLVNGMGTFCSAGARVIAPVASTAVFTATSNGNLPFPLNYSFVFICMSAICVLCMAVTFLLRSNVDKRRDRNTREVSTSLIEEVVTSPSATELVLLECGLSHTQPESPCADGSPLEAENRQSISSSDLAVKL